MIQGLARGRAKVADFLELSKPRIIMMVLLTTTVGFYVAAPRGVGLGLLLHVLVATALAAAGSLALNQYLERDLDARMIRTRRRPLPDGRLKAGAALAFGASTTLVGLAYMALAANTLAALVAAVIALSYLAIYTPLKRRTSLCSFVGAVPGALPPVVGAAASSGTLGVEAGVLFAIMFLWQIPHALAIACIYRDDYARGGVWVLPVLDPAGPDTGLNVVLNCAALLPAALLPNLTGLAGPGYLLAALVLGVGLLMCAVAMAVRGERADARRLLFASLIYLPALLAAMAIDKGVV